MRKLILGTITAALVVTFGFADTADARRTRYRYNVRPHHHHYHQPHYGGYYYHGQHYHPRYNYGWHNNRGYYGRGGVTIRGRRGAVRFRW